VEFVDFLFENEIAIGVVGLALSVLVGFVGLRVGQLKAVYAAVGLGLLTAILCGLSVWIETDREQIRRTMNEIANALRENDHPKVISFFHPNATMGLQQVQGELPQYEFLDARVTRVRQIAINNTTQPPTAVSEFLAAIEVKLKNPSLYNGPRDARRFLKVYWMKKDDRWLVRDYEHFEPMRAFTDQE
jgi:hypothetical protein